MYTPACLPSSVPLLCHTHRTFLWPTMLLSPATLCTFTLSHTQNISVAYHYLPPSLPLPSQTQDISVAYHAAITCHLAYLYCLTHRTFLWLLASLHSVSHTGMTFLWLLAYLHSVSHKGRTFLWLVAYLRSVSHTGRPFMWLLAYLHSISHTGHFCGLPCCHYSHTAGISV